MDMYTSHVHNSPKMSSINWPCLLEDGERLEKLFSSTELLDTIKSLPVNNEDVPSKFYKESQDVLYHC